MMDDLIIENNEQNMNLVDENAALKAELEALKASIESEKKQNEQKREFCELFPDVSLDDIPSPVFEYVNTHGGTLAGAFAIHHRRECLKSERSEQKKLENALKAPGDIGISAGACAERLFTSDEIRCMNKEQVRRNYKQIMKSLKYGK